MSILDELKAKREELNSEMWRLHRERQAIAKANGTEIEYSPEIHHLQNEINKLNVRIRNITGDDGMRYVVDGVLL